MSLAEFDKFIALDMALSEWSDGAIEVAISMMSEFSDADWQLLPQVIGQKGTAWRQRLAEWLDSAKRSEPLTCLYLLLDTDDPGVFFAAAESIQRFDALDPQGIDVAALEKRYARLQSTDATDEVEEVIFSELLGKLRAVGS